MLIVPLNAQDVWSLYSIKDNKLLPLPFQVPYVDRFVGSSNRWLVTVDDDLVVRLLNPLCLVLRSKQIDRDLNTYITLPSLDPPCFVFNHIRKVVLSANQTSIPDDYMVMAIFSVDHHLDSEGWEWREMKNIGDCALFVGDNISLSAVASDFCGCQSNCIYFIDDYENFLFPSMVLENSYALKNTKDVGVYNMETRSFTPYDIAKDDVWLADTTKLRIVPSSVVYKPV
ncbi:hypothetical protein Gohar_011677 [Gossypium harknessii]|uniref:KIB1-4 beta-propeller domain-containing protein n=1 Tax=Gossypium harknessii TaxID=34285 RepID=A0A7J9GW23_9ROSI|nr:hypothetical protein [Gossypium harknessii]